MPSPLCTVQDGTGVKQSTTAVSSVTPGNTVTIALSDATGVSTWTVECVSTDDSVATNQISLVINSTAKTATFVPPAAGQAYLIKSTVNAGQNANGQVDPTLAYQFKIATPTAYGSYVVAANETTEHGSFGWLPALNDACRGASLANALSFFPSFRKYAPDGGVSIYRRGDSISGLTYQGSYVGSLPTSVTVTTSTSGTFSSTPTANAASFPFDSFGFTGTLSATGSDASPDPSFTVTLAASFNPGKATVNPALTTTKTVAQTVYFASDIYFGYSTSSSITATQVFNTTLQTGFFDRLQRMRTGSFALTTPASNNYHIYFLWPSEAQYTTGTPVFYHQGAPYAYQQAGQVSIARNGVTRTYTVWRTLQAWYPNSTVAIVVT